MKKLIFACTLALLAGCSGMGMHGKSGFTSGSSGMTGTGATGRDSAADNPSFQRFVDQSSPYFGA